MLPDGRMCHKENPLDEEWSILQKKLSERIKEGLAEEVALEFLEYELRRVEFYYVNSTPKKPETISVYITPDTARLVYPSERDIEVLGAFYKLDKKAASGLDSLDPFVLAKLSYDLGMALAYSTDRPQYCARVEKAPPVLIPLNKIRNEKLVKALFESKLDLEEAKHKEAWAGLEFTAAIMERYAHRKEALETELKSLEQNRDQEVKESINKQAAEKQRYDGKFTDLTMRMRYETKVREDEGMKKDA
ncbi:MAG: hypothetical protein FWE53_00125 [Firmicutes bacterium]|nr:hypothetical protein [Bacillota bacterium]